MNASTFGTTQKVSLGPIVAWTMGNGDSMLVIHGGPGMDHSYLTGPLAPLCDLRQLVFYDQVLSSTSSVGPVEQLVSQLLSVVERLGSAGSLSVFAHSWGAYLLYELLNRRSDMNLRELVLVSPVGLTKARFDASGERIVQRVPPSLISQIQDLEEEGRDVEIMRRLFPYYLAPDNHALACDIHWYSNQINGRVIDDIPDYDFREIGNRFPHNALLIYGDHDVELPEDTVEAHEDTVVRVISGAGHFAFCERPAEFQKIVRSHLASE